MPLIQRPYQLLSDLVVHEVDPSVGYSRKVVGVTVASDTTLKPGSVVFRAKGTDPTVAYSVVTDATSFVLTNEFAVVIGDYYGYELSPILVTAATSPNSMTVYKRGQVILKDFTILAAVQLNFAGITTTQFGVLKHLLELQDVLVETAGTIVRPSI
jgi:hypothetical protein